MTDQIQAPTGLNRRTLVKAAAWSAPALSVAVASPAMAASVVTELDVVIDQANCTLAGLATSPRFVIRAVNGEIPAGTVFELTPGAGLSVGVNLDLNGLGADFQVLNNGDTITLLLDEAIPQGGSLDVPFLTNTIQVGVNRNARLSLVSLPAGYEDSNSGNNTIRLSWTGIRVAFVSLFSCSHSR
jgi:hypothetical protein